jgi:C4-dicarboxylate-specific signal transduction histidine kinase
MISHLVAPIINELKDLATARFGAHDVTLEFGELRANIELEMNPTLISQVVLNLMNNALDAVVEQKEKWVKVDFAEDNDSLFVSVTDSGPGIPIKNRGRIFDAFFTTKEPGKGTGLGLSLASSIAAHHHGSLRLDTLHPRTRFVLQLPKRQPDKFKKAS